MNSEFYHVLRYLRPYSHFYRTCSPTLSGYARCVSLWWRVELSQFCCSKQWFPKPLRKSGVHRKLKPLRFSSFFGNSAAVYTCLFVVLPRMTRINFSFAGKQALSLGRPGIQNWESANVKIKREETGERKAGGACNHFFKRLVPVYQLLVYPLIGQIRQVISKLSKWVVPATQNDGVRRPRA